MTENEPCYYEVRGYFTKADFESAESDILEECLEDWNEAVAIARRLLRSREFEVVKVQSHDHEAGTTLTIDPSSNLIVSLRW